MQSGELILLTIKVSVVSLASRVLHLEADWGVGSGRARGGG